MHIQLDEKLERSVERMDGRCLKVWVSGWLRSWVICLGSGWERIGKGGCVNGRVRKG